MQIIAIMIGPAPMAILLYWIYSAYNPATYVQFIVGYIISTVLFWPSLLVVRACQRKIPKLARRSDAIPIAVGACLAGILTSITMVVFSSRSNAVALVLIFVVGAWGTFAGLIAYETILGRKIRWLPQTGA